MSENTGRVSQIIGPVVDVTFDNNEAGLPDIYDSLEIIRANGDKLILECQQHIGENTIRAVSMDSTDGLRRGMEVKTTGQPILEEFATEELLRTRVDSLKGDGYYQDNFYEEEL